MESYEFAENISITRKDCTISRHNATLETTQILQTFVERNKSIPNFTENVSDHSWRCRSFENSTTNVQKPRFDECSADLNPHICMWKGMNGKQLDLVQPRVSSGYIMRPNQSCRWYPDRFDKPLIHWQLVGALANATPSTPKAATSLASLPHHVNDRRLYLSHELLVSRVTPLLFVTGLIQQSLCDYIINRRTVYVYAQNTAAIHGGRLFTKQRFKAITNDPFYRLVRLPAFYFDTDFIRNRRSKITVILYSNFSFFL